MKAELPKNFSDISNQLLSKLNGMDTRQRYLVFGGLLLFIFVLDYLILMKPQLNALNKLNPQIKTLSDEMKTNKENMQKLDYYKTESEKLSEKVAEMGSRVSSKEEISLILEEISQLANENHVKIDQIMPKNENMEKLTLNNGKQYYSLPIEIEAKSNFHKLGKFINKLESAGIYFTIGSLNIIPSDDPTQQAVKLTVNATVYEPVKK